MTEKQAFKPKIMTEEERQKKRELSRKLMSSLQKHVLVCNGGCCTLKADGEDVLQAFKTAVDTHDIEKKVRVTATQCLSRCGDACTVVVYPEGTWYKNIKPDAVEDFVKNDLLNSSTFEKQVSYTYREGRFVEKN